MRDVLSFVNELARDIRIHGYCSILNGEIIAEETDLLRKYLLAEFNELLFIEIDNFKKYFINTKSGKSIVLKLLNSSIYYARRSIVLAEQRGESSINQSAEYIRLNQLKKLLESTKFKQ